MTPSKRVLAAMCLTGAIAVAAGLFWGGEVPPEERAPQKNSAVPRDDQALLERVHRKPHVRHLPSVNEPGMGSNEGYQISDEEIKDLLADVPTKEVALIQRAEDSPVVEGVLKRGVDALLEPESCPAGFELETSARRGSGALGCVRLEQGRRVYEGKVAFRRAMPVPPGARPMPPVYELGSFSEGKRNGEFKLFDSTGRNTSVRYYKDDALSGPLDDFSIEGKHLSRSNYLDGYLHGTVIRYLGDDVAIELWGYGAPLDPHTGARLPGARELELAGKTP